MPSIDNLLRDELKRVTDTVRPGQLRPLRIPAPGRRWRQRLLPVAEAAGIRGVGATISRLPFAGHPEEVAAARLS